MAGCKIEKVKEKRSQKQVENCRIVCPCPILARKRALAMFVKDLSHDKECILCLHSNYFGRSFEYHPYSVYDCADAAQMNSRNRQKKSFEIIWIRGDVVRAKSR